jgi:hypothetical protein
MEIRYVNAPWIQFQIHPETYQKIKFCSTLRGMSTREFVEEALSASLKARLSDLVSGAAGDDLADRYGSARVQLSPLA